MEMAQTARLGDSIVKRYRFEWDDGSERTSDEIPTSNEDFLEEVVECARDDPECEVTHIGYTT
jgi:ribonuclease HI